MSLIKNLLSKIEPGRKVGILYDVGCTNIDRVCQVFLFHTKSFCDLTLLSHFKRKLIPQYRRQLKFGTLVFHAYAHNWLCQLEFHPLFNKGWGLSDGEGLERLWSYLSPLVSPLRYATRNHRLSSVSHRLKPHNEKGIKKLCEYTFWREYCK